MPGKRLPPPTVRVGYHCIATGEEKVGELPPEEVFAANLESAYRPFGVAVKVTVIENDLPPKDWSKAFRFAGDSVEYA